MNVFDDLHQKNLEWIEFKNAIELANIDVKEIEALHYGGGQSLLYLKDKLYKEYECRPYLYDKSIKQYSDLPEDAGFDIVYCSDILETASNKERKNVLKDILKHAEGLAYFNIVLESKSEEEQWNDNINRCLEKYNVNNVQCFVAYHCDNEMKSIAFKTNKKEPQFYNTKYDI